MSGGDVTGVRLVFVTHPTSGARAFARELVEAGIAVCVQIIPAASVFRWEGEITEAEESLLLVKTCALRVGDLEQFLGEHHPYEVPECISVQPDRVADRYREWVISETSGGIGGAKDVAD